jgi:hypothetical protein
MQGETVQWDLRSINVHSSGLSQIFAMYILALFLIGSSKVVRVWRILLQRLPGDQGGYIQELDKVTDSIGKWIQFTFLLWGLYVCLLVARACLVWVTLSPHYLLVWPTVLHEIAALTASMLSAATLLFLGRWYVERRAGFLAKPIRN